MTSEHAPETDFPSTLEHKHGLDEWWPMMAERSAETIEPGKQPTERIYVCQKVGCGEQVRIAAGQLRAPGAT